MRILDAPDKFGSKRIQQLISESDNLRRGLSAALSASHTEICDYVSSFAPAFFLLKQ